jgi:hypothetical protein
MRVCLCRSWRDGGAVGIIEERDEKREKKKKKCYEEREKKLKKYNKIIILIKIERV